MSPRRRRGSPARTAPTPTNNAAYDDLQPIPGVPFAPARRYAPSANRTLPVDIVDPCPYCPDGRHVHRAGKSALRRAGCGRGWYVIAPEPAASHKNTLGVA